MKPTNPLYESQDLVSLSEVALSAGISYRQADYWVRRGFIEAPMFRNQVGVLEYVGNEGRSGRGRQRRMIAIEARVLHTMARLIRAGFQLELAAKLAREWVDTGEARLIIGPGLTLEIGETPDE